MDFVEAVRRIRNEHPEVGGLVMAKRLVEKYGTYEAAKAAITDGRPDPELERQKELVALRSQVADLKERLRNTEEELASARAALSGEA